MWNGCACQGAASEWGTADGGCGEHAGELDRAVWLGDATEAYVRRFMINPDEAAESVAGFRWRHDRCRDWNRAASDGVSTHERLQRIAAAIVRRYATYAIGVEAVTAAPGVAPGWGTVAALGGGVVDLGVSMKIQTDMVMCLVALYADELSNAEKVEVALGIALTSSADQFACGAATTPVDDTDRKSVV